MTRINTEKGIELARMVRDRVSNLKPFTEGKKIIMDFEPTENCSKRIKSRRNRKTNVQRSK